jgi:hypothetical protein
MPNSSAWVPSEILLAEVDKSDMRQGSAWAHICHHVVAGVQLSQTREAEGAVQRV